MRVGDLLFQRQHFLLPLLNVVLRRRPPAVRRGVSSVLVVTDSGCAGVVLIPRWRGVVVSVVLVPRWLHRFRRIIRIASSVDRQSSFEELALQRLIRRLS